MQFVERLDRIALDVLGKVETGAECRAMAEDDAGLGLLLGALHRRLDARDQCLAQRIALVRTVEADDRDVAVACIGDDIGGHAPGDPFPVFDATGH